MIAAFRAFLLTLGLAMPAQADDITVFAAASLGDAMGDLAEAWQGTASHSVTLVLAGSSTLARQIDAGAPADVFVSANTDWMDWLEGRDRIAPNSRFDLASNRLVLIAAEADMASDQEVTAQTDLNAMLGAHGRLAVALPEAVPAGMYAKDALTNLKLWDSVSDRLAPTDNARAALALVALGEALLGVVYATDALAEPRVHIAGVFPADAHPVIRYPAAMVADTEDADTSAAFLDWLQSDAARAILDDHGFLPPDAQE